MAETQEVRVQVEVVEIDRATRRLTVRGPDGPYDVIADERVKRFDAIRVGDTIKVAYWHAMALEISTGSGIRERSTAVSEAAPAGAGGRPAGSGLIEETIVADIVRVDSVLGAVLVRGAKGRVAWLQVPRADLLSTLKPGAQATIRYRQAVAIAFEPARP
jgi:hypothetical protein